MANWFSDTWREITSGGKARTETYNRREPEPRRTSSPTPKRTTSTPRTSSGGGGGGGRVSASAARTPVRLSVDREEAPRPSTYVRRPEAPAPAPGRQLSPAGVKRQEAELDRYRVDPQLTGAEAAAQQQQMVGRAAMARLDPTLQVTPKTPVMERSERAGELERAEQAERAAANAAPKPQIKTNVRELTDEEYLALTPRQRAAVQFNTGLVGASRADEQAGGTANTESFLSSIDLAPEGDLDAYLSLDRAIGTSILARLDDPAARQQSAEARRWARGTPGAAPQSEEFASARSNADRAATAMMDALGRGYTGLGQTQGSTSVADALAGGAVSGRAGFGTAPRDVVIQQAFDAMIASDANFTPEQVANGIANLNDMNGTDVDPQEVWDFAKLRLDAADMAQLAGENFVLPVTDATIVPLSAADIRARYGI